MSEILENLNDALAGKIFVEAPLEEFGKSGQAMAFKGNIQSLKQFVCTPDGVNEGPAIGMKTDYSKKSEFSITTIQTLVLLISQWSLKIRFVPLILPSNVIKSSMCRHKNIIGRYVEFYEQMSDEIGKRWDFLIQKLD